MRPYSFKCIPPGTMVAYYDASRCRFVYNLVTKTRFFHKPTYDTLHLSLFALKQYVLSHNIKEISIPRLGTGFDRLHWPTVLALFLSSYREDKYYYRTSFNPLVADCPTISASMTFQRDLPF